MSRPTILLRNIAIFLATATGSPHAMGQSSTTYQVNAQHTGYVKTTGSFASPLKPLWAVDLGGPISYPIVAENMVFVTVSDVNNYGSQLFALSAKTGATIWQKAISGTYFSSYAVYDSGVIFEINFDGVLQAFKAATGAVLWTEQVPLQSEFSWPPTAKDGFLYISGVGAGGTIFKIKEKNGAVDLKIQSNALGGILGVLGGQIFTADSCDAYAFSAKSGQVNWHDNAGCNDGVSGTASIYDNRFFAPYYDGSNVQFDIKTGKLVGSFASGDPAFYAGLMFQAEQSSIVATQFLSGNIAWTVSPEDSFTTPPLVVNKTVYALSETGYLYALDEGTGALEQKLNPGVGKNQSEGMPVMPGLGAGGGVLVVPSVSLLTAYVPE
jgi:outer membrane protein assembly factor BamB